MSNEEINFKSIYKSLDRQIFLEKLASNVFWWIVAIIMIIVFAGILSGRLDWGSGKCYFDERIGDVVCREKP